MVTQDGAPTEISLTLVWQDGRVINFSFAPFLFDLIRLFGHARLQPG